MVCFFIGPQRHNLEFTDWSRVQWMFCCGEKAILRWTAKLHWQFNSIFQNEAFIIFGPKKVMKKKKFLKDTFFWNTLYLVWKTYDLEYVWLQTSYGWSAELRIQDGVECGNSPVQYCLNKIIFEVNIFVEINYWFTKEENYIMDFLMFLNLGFFLSIKYTYISNSVKKPK